MGGGYSKIQRKGIQIEGECSFLLIAIRWMAKLYLLLTPCHNSSLHILNIPHHTMLEGSGRFLRRWDYVANMGSFGWI